MQQMQTFWASRIIWVHLGLKYEVLPVSSRMQALAWAATPMQASPPDHDKMSAATEAVAAAVRAA